MPRRTLHEAYSVGSYVDYEKIVQAPNGTKLRITMHADSSYAFQSSLLVEVWTADGWKMVLRPPSLSLRTVWEGASPHSRDQAHVRGLIETTAESFLDTASKIVGSPAKLED